MECDCERIKEQNKILHNRVEIIEDQLREISKIILHEEYKSIECLKNEWTK